MPDYIILLGPPGAGKGTQAQLISEKVGIPHISSGEIFRENLHNQTELGKRAQAFMDRGDLVPDDLTIAMIRERLTRADCSGGALLDGFPRTTPQAKALDTMIAELRGQVKFVLLIDVPEAILVERLAGRWTCRKDGSHVYHEKHHPPRVAGRCDFDDGELYQREDQTTEAVARRIMVYTQQTTPLVDYYRQAGKLVVIDGAHSIEDVTADVLAVLAG